MDTNSVRSKRQFYGLHQQFAQQWRQHILKSTWFRFFQKRNLSQSKRIMPECFALGRSETSTDTAVGARQQSSVRQGNPVLYCSRTRIAYQLGPFV